MNTLHEVNQTLGRHCNGVQRRFLCACIMQTCKHACKERAPALEEERVRGGGGGGRV